MPNRIVQRDPFDRDEAKSLINQMAADEATKITYVKHARERADERELNPVWIQKVLRLGDVIDVREHEFLGGKKQIRYKVRHIDKYGRTDVITVIASNERLVIVTVMRRDAV